MPPTPSTLASYNTRTHKMPLLHSSSSSIARALFLRTTPKYRRSATTTSYSPPRAILDQVVTHTADQPPSPSPTEATTTPTPNSPEQPNAPSPGVADRERFRLHWSVDMWRDFNPRSWLTVIGDDTAPAADRLRAAVDTFTNAISTSGVLSSPQAAQYWTYHTARSGFFAVQAIVGLAAARFAASSDVSDNGPLTRWEQIARNGWQGPLAEAFLSYYQDYEMIKEGTYKMPYDGVELRPTNRQFNPLYILRKGALFLSEATETLRRRERNAPDEVWLRSAFFPPYYESNTFHYQSDGWLSARSAAVYESSTETLFVGRQDAMQRTTLVHFSEFFADKATVYTDPSQVKALEIACGTGRFATFVKDNYPTLDLTVSDLSPFYLAAARDNIKYWKRLRDADAVMPGVDGNGTTFLQAAAESLSTIDDASFDIVYCVYLFHELPEDVRTQVVKEMARVVKPGGMVVLTDSVQVGDRPCYDGTLSGFGKFNEPYYENYLVTDLGGLFEEAGLTPNLKVVSSTTKSLSFVKKEEGAGGVDGGAITVDTTLLN